MNVVAEVIVPTFQHSELLPFCIESIQRQTITNIGIHIVGEIPLRRELFEFVPDHYRR